MVILGSKSHYFFKVLDRGLNFFSLPFRLLVQEWSGTVSCAQLLSPPEYSYLDTTGCSTATIPESALFHASTLIAFVHFRHLMHPVLICQDIIQHNLAVVQSRVRGLCYLIALYAHTSRRLSSQKAFEKSWNSDVPI